MRSMIRPELLHLAETLHRDSELRTDGGLCQSAELLIIACSLNMRLVTSGNSRVDGILFDGGSDLC